MLIITVKCESNCNTFRYLHLKRKKKWLLNYLLSQFNSHLIYNIVKSVFNGFNRQNNTVNRHDTNHGSL